MQKVHPNLQMTGNHLFELLYRCSSSGFVKECNLFLWLQLLSQFIVQDVTQLTLDDTIMITPAACIDLRATEEHTVIMTVLRLMWFQGWPILLLEGALFIQSLALTHLHESFLVFLFPEDLYLAGHGVFN